MDGVCWCFLCDRHAGSVDNITRDMEPDHRATQLAEARKLFEQAGVPFVDPGFVSSVNVTDLVPPE
jgi:hypothetical protein